MSEISERYRQTQRRVRGQDRGRPGRQMGRADAVRRLDRARPRRPRRRHAGHVPRLRRAASWAISRRSTTTRPRRGTRPDRECSASSTIPSTHGPSSRASRVRRRSKPQSTDSCASDLVVHGWDLARTAGLDEHIEPEDIARVRAQAEAFGDALRSPQAFGPEVEAPAGADDQTKLLAFLGRNPVS